MLRRRSINAHIGWHQVLPLLGIKAASTSIPLMVPCPMCRKPRLTIYNDSKFGGNWHYCPDCHSSGDMIELAAKTWKISLEDTIRRLVASGLPFPADAVTQEAIRRYEQGYVAEQTHIRRLREDSRRLMADGDVQLERVLQQMGLPQDHQRAYWRKRMGRFIGGADKLRCIQGFYPHAGPRKENSVGRNEHANMFRGKGWNDMLVVPFHDLPERCAGVLFIGRHAERDKDYTFRLVDSKLAPHGAAAAVAEIGVCMADVLNGPTSHAQLFKNQVFVIPDPATALKLQARHMKDADLPLPIVGTYNALVRRQTRKWELRTYDFWRTRPDKRFIFWDKVLSANLFNMAARADGLVSIVPAAQYTWRRPPHMWLRDMQRRARPWAEALEAHLRVIPEDAAATLLQNIDIPPDMLMQFTDGCCDEVQELLERHRKAATQFHNTTVRGQGIEEMSNGWHVAKTGECVCDAILRVEKVICIEDDEDADPYYQGRIIYGNEQVEFVEPMSKIESDPGTWLKKKVLSKLGKMVVIKRAWAPHIFDIARGLHTPEVIREDGKFGWKPRDSCFSLPKFAVHVGGEVCDEPAHVVDAWAPGQDLDAPTAVIPDLSPLLEDSPANALVWATAACIGANILAPAVGQHVTGIGLIGHGAVLCGKETARTCGCCEYSSASATPAGIDKSLGVITDVTARHRWPLMVNMQNQARRVQDVMAHGGYEANTILCTDKWHADVWSLVGSWRFINGPKAVEPGAHVRQLLPRVLPLWLRRISQRKFKLESHADEYLIRVIDDMASMMQEHGPVKVIYEAGSRVDNVAELPKKPAQKLVALLHEQICDGYIRFARPGDTTKGRGATIVRCAPKDRAPGIFIPRVAITGICEKRGVMPPDPARVSDAFKAANALDGECEYDNERGWFISESWWNKQIDRCNSNPQHRLKVIGGDE